MQKAFHILNSGYAGRDGKITTNQQFNDDPPLYPLGVVIKPGRAVAANEQLKTVDSGIIEDQGDIDLTERTYADDTEPPLYPTGLCENCE